MDYIREKDLKFLKDNKVTVLLSPHVNDDATKYEVMGSSSCDGDFPVLWVANDLSTVNQTEAFNHEVAHCIEAINRKRKNLPSDKYLGNLLQWDKAASEQRAEKFRVRERLKSPITFVKEFGDYVE
jgi:hypothetical protein